MKAASHLQTMVTVRTDASHLLGYGHLYRTLPVAQRLQALGDIAVRYLMDPSSDARPVESAGLDVVRALPGIAESITAMVRPEDGPVILDSYAVTEKDLRGLRNAGYTTVTFDDSKRLGWYATNVLIDAAPDAEGLGYRSPEETILCLGPGYFPLREPSPQRAESGHHGAVSRVVVTFGGSDPEDQTSRVLSSVFARHAHPWQVTTVLGPGYRGEAEDLAKNLPFVKIRRNVARMSEVFRDADLAVSGGGGTSFELAYHGVPTVTLELSADQHAAASGFHKAGATMNLGWHAQVKDSEIWEALEGLAANPSRLQAMSAAGRKIVDGQGAQRVAEAILDAWYLRTAVFPYSSGASG